MTKTAAALKRAARPREQDVHMGIARLLSLAAPKHVMWWHTPNGERRDARTGGKLRRMGVVPGTPDFLLYDTRTGYLYCLEVKRPGEYLSDAQRGWKSRFDASPTGRYAVARSVEEAKDILGEWWPK